MAQGFVVRVQGSGSDEVLKERIARLLCPVEDHDAPCEVPWGFTLADDTGHQEGDEHPEGLEFPDVADDLLLAIYTTPDKAADVAERVRTAIGRPVALSVGDPADFEDLATQYRIENA